MRERDEASAHVSVTLIERLDASGWQALAKPAKRLKPGDRIRSARAGNVCLLGSLGAIVEAPGRRGRGDARLRLCGAALDEAIAGLGQMPLPPLHRFAPGARRSRPQRLSDDLCEGGGRRCRADRGAALHGSPDAGACRREACHGIS